MKIAIGIVIGIVVGVVGVYILTLREMLRDFESGLEQ